MCWKYEQGAEYKLCLYNHKYKYLNFIFNIFYGKKSGEAEIPTIWS